MKEMIRIKWLLGHTQRDAAKRTRNMSLSIRLGRGKDRNGHAIRPMSAGAPNGRPIVPANSAWEALSLSRQIGHRSLSSKITANSRPNSIVFQI